MKNKIITISEAASKVKSGMTLMVGGFLNNGSPNSVLKKVSEMSVNDLTIISNDTSFQDLGQGLLISNRQVKKVITSHIGTNPMTGQLLNNKELEVEFSPQGTLAERIRAAGAGLGGVLTPTGIGTKVAEGKQIFEISGKNYLLETPLKAEIAIIKASKADKEGNLYFLGNSRNFNPIMAMAADYVIVEAEEIVEVGAIKPEDVHSPAIFIDAICLSEN